jgi:hypothetical protein
MITKLDRGLSEYGTPMKILFKCGEIVSTPGALDLMREHNADPRSFLRRHLHGDWGDVCQEDADENAFSVLNGFRIMSVYKLGGEKLWLITEADRSATTFLLPEEY